MAKSAAYSIRIRSHAQEIVIGILVLMTYLPSLLWMWDRWFARDTYYSHGILIPFVTAFLIWHKRRVLRTIPVKSSPWGMRLITLGISIHLLSALFQVYFTSGFSLIIVLFGLVLHIYGSRMLKELAFPLSFLVFMIPLPMVVVANMSFKLKIFAAEIATFLLNSMRIPCVQDGSMIIMRHASVVVDDVCSGLRSLIALMALGAIFAYWMRGGWIKKSIIFLSSIPIAVITNVMRIGFLSTVSEVWGSKYAAGFLHELSGFIVFALAFLLLYVFVEILE